MMARAVIPGARHRWVGEEKQGVAALARAAGRRRASTGGDPCKEPHGSRVGATVPVGCAAGRESARLARTPARCQRGVSCAGVDGARRLDGPKVPLAVESQHRAARPTAPARGAVALARVWTWRDLTARRSLHHAPDRGAIEPRRPGTKQLFDVTRDISSHTPRRRLAEKAKVSVAIAQGESRDARALLAPRSPIPRRMCIGG